MRWLGIMLMAALLASAPGYGNAQPAGKKDPSPGTQPQSPAVKLEPVGAVKTYIPEERKAYEKNTAAELEAIEQRTDELVLKAGKVKPQKKRTFIKNTRALAVQTMAARNQFTALEKAPENAWGGLKADMDRAMQELRKLREAAELNLK
jgi:hypothetical protein